MVKIAFFNLSLFYANFRTFACSKFWIGLGGMLRNLTGLQPRKHPLTVYQWKFPNVMRLWLPLSYGKFKSSVVHNIVQTSTWFTSSKRHLSETYKLKLFLKAILISYVELTWFPIYFFCTLPKLQKWKGELTSVLLLSFMRLVAQ